MPAKRLAFLLCEWACKPGSVIDGHLSGTHVAARLKPPPRDGRAGRMSLHGVAPDRVYSIHLSPGDGRALISAFPPLPGAKPGGISLLHLSEGRPWRVLPVILALWSPDFPHVTAFARHARPSGPLAGIFYPPQRPASSLGTIKLLYSGVIEVIIMG